MVLNMLYFALLCICVFMLSTSALLRPFTILKSTTSLAYAQDTQDNMRKSKIPKESSKEYISRESSMESSRESSRERKVRIDGMFKQMRGASEEGNSKMLTEGSKYVLKFEVIIGRIAMTLFTLALLLEFFSGETFLQQFEQGVTTVEKYGMLTSSIVCGSMLFVGSMILEEC